MVTLHVLAIVILVHGFFFQEHPSMMLKMIIMLSMLISFSLFIYMVFFFSLTWILVYVGGMMIIFTYAVFLAEENMSSLKEKHASQPNQLSTKDFVMISFLGLICPFFLSDNVWESVYDVFILSEVEMTNENIQGYFMEAMSMSSTFLPFLGLIVYVLSMVLIFLKAKKKSTLAHIMEGKNGWP